MILAEMLNRSPLQQQRVADEYSIARDLSRSRHGTIQDPAKASQYRPHVLPGLIRDENPAPIDMRGDYGLADLLMGTMPMAGITAFHGSPHLFNKFDMSKIGSGEGAQAYGHGLYFSENPAVAKEYKNKLASGQLHRPDGSVFDPHEHLSNINVRATLQKTDGDVGKTIDRANEIIKSIPGTQGAEYAKKDIRVLSQLQELHRPDANLYKVDIPDDQIAKMLDWDKPLSEQPNLLKALKPMIENRPSVKYQLMEEPNMQGRRLYDVLFADEYAKGGSEALGTAELNKLGIPGIKYLDQGSRQGGKGTQNFVLFDDQIPQILAINDAPIARALAGR